MPRDRMTRDQYETASRNLQDGTRRLHDARGDCPSCNGHGGDAHAGVACSGCGGSGMAGEHDADKWERALQRRWMRGYVPPEPDFF